MNRLGCLSDDTDDFGVPSGLLDEHRICSDMTSDGKCSSGSSKVGSMISLPKRRSAAPVRRKRPVSLALVPTSKFHPAHDRALGSQLQTKRRNIVRRFPSSPIEALPNEVLQQIAGCVEHDSDLCNLSLSSPLFPFKINRDESEIWRTRFLARYDHPIISDAYDFSTAYKLRRLVLKSFISFANGIDRRAEIQLDVVRDMIIETYHKPKPWMPTPAISLNLRTFESPGQSSWINAFFFSAYPGITDGRKWGEQHPYFETIQLVLSHLLLSSASALSLAVSSRESYDLALVYSFNQPLTTLYTCLPVVPPGPPRLKSALFPNLRPREPEPAPKRYSLETHTLLHIRNFWHRHLIGDSFFGGEHTYADMAKHLKRIGKSPAKWDQALDNAITIPTQWFGNYSALYPWPKTRKELEERQSSAEDWDHVDPMMLDFVISNDYAAGFWPPAFSTIPAFDDTIPASEVSHDFDDSSNFTWQRRGSKSRITGTSHNFPNINDGPVYIRGTAPFINTRQEQPDHRSSQYVSLTPSTAQERVRDDFLKYHPFTALRIRGVIHDILPATTLDNDPYAEAKAIPGWKRIVMVLYKPNITYLINVLEHAEENYGGAFGAQVTQALNTANVWSTGSSAAAAGGAGGSATGSIVQGNDQDMNDVTSASTSVPVQSNIAQQSLTTTTTTQQPPAPSPTPTTNTTNSATDTNTLPIPIATLRTHLLTRLHTLLTSPTCPLPVTNSPTTPPTAQIIDLEDKYIPAHYLSWEDGSIDYAYAYEGIVLPGGKIMMGRWWRCHGLLGTGPGWEVGTDGEGVDDGDGDGDGAGGHEVDNAATGTELGNGNASAPRRSGLERGPFIFWC